MKWVALVMDHGPKGRSAKLLLLALADRADENGVCWPSRADLRERALMSDATVTRMLRALEAEGWVQRSRRFNASNLFRVNVWKLMEAEAAKRAAPKVPAGFEPFPEELAAQAKAAQATENKGSAHGERGSAHGERGSAQPATTNRSRTCQEPAKVASSRERKENLQAWLAVAPRGWTFADKVAWERSRV